MSDPLSYLPLALAGANGVLDGIDIRRLIAAGVALLQRTAPLVRALHGRRSALLIPGGPSFFVALAASEGRGALLLDPRAGSSELAESLGSGGVGAAFTVSALEHRLPAALPRVLLDDVPARATWRIGEESRTIELAIHDGLHLEGEDDVAGADEEVLVASRGDAAGDALGTPITHRRLLACARATARGAKLAARDHTLALAPYARLFGLVTGAIAPLLAGGRVTTGNAFTPAQSLRALEQDGVSMLVGAPVQFAALLDELARRGHPLDAPVLKRCVAGGAPLDASLRARWYDRVGVVLAQGDAMAGDAGFAVGDPGPGT